MAQLQALTYLIGCTQHVAHTMCCRAHKSRVRIM
jgi:hypothetical protein